jgi:ketoreductase
MSHQMTAVLKHTTQTPGPSRFSGKVVIVTGAGQGIGRAVALRFAREGAALALWDLNVDTAAATAKIINDTKGRAEAFAVDVTNSDRVESAMADVVARFGQADVLVNNVGGGGAPPKMLDELEERFWDGALSSNLKSTFLCSKFFARAAKSGGRPASIINVGSVNGKSGTPLLGAYSVAKAGVIRLTEVLAREMASSRINVNCVCPGVVETEITQKILNRYPDIFVKAYGLVLKDELGVRAALEQRIPLGRLAKPDDVAAAVTFLASDDAAYITGQAINVCGGMMAS